MGLYTVHETQEIVREALVEANSADEARMYFDRMPTHSGRVDVHKKTVERHVIVKEYEEADK